MQPNRVKAALKSGETVIGPIIAEARSLGTIKMMAEAGHDFLFLDMEHAMYDWETMSNLVQVALLCEIVPIVRVTDLAYSLVARAFDSGAQGVILPRIETREQADLAISFAKYPPFGRRGAGGDGRTAYRHDLTTRQIVEQANEHSLVVLQIESLAGVEAIEEIAQAPGLDVILIGPQDLSISMDLHGQFTHPDFVATLAKVIDACNRHGVATGMVERDAASHQLWHEMGMRFLVTNTDANMIYQSALRDVAALRAL